MTIPRFASLWAINAPLDTAELRRQLAGFAEDGLDGVVFHPRFYPGEPAYLGDEYLDFVADAIEAAAALGLDFWIYDENGWPSGTVGGRMLTEHPELRQRWLELRPAGNLPPGSTSLLAIDRDGAAFHLVERIGDGVDYLSPDLAGRFLELCYARYADGLPRDAFRHVAGFFSDEPEFGLGHSHHDLPPDGAVPWTPDLPAAYAARHGEDLVPLLPALFGPHPRAAEVRERFWELVTDLFAERFLARIDEWCRSRGVRFTAHVKGEEHPLFQVPTVGSLGAVARRMDLPGLDALGRDPGNDFYPRLVSSAARQFGDGRCMAEAFGGAGWGAGPADLERMLLWLGDHGVTDVMLHIAQYRLDSVAIEDWPPSQPTHLSWRPAYAELIQRVREHLTGSPRPPADTLVVVPQRGIMRAFEAGEFVRMNVHDAHDYADSAAGRINAEFLALVERLHAAGVAYDFVDERTLESEGRIVGGELHVGAARYRRIVVARGAVLQEDWQRRTAALLADTPPHAPRPAGAAQPSRSGSRARPGGEADLGRLEWRLARPPRNDLVLEATPEPEGWYSASIRNRGFTGAASLHFADELRELTWDGTSLPIAGDPAVARVLVERSSSVHRVRFRPARPLQPEVRPRLWLSGGFHVTVEGRWHHRGDVSVVAGDFALAAPPPSGSPLNGAVEPTVDGFPFLFEPLHLTTSLDLPFGARSLLLSGARAAAALVTVGGAEPRWCWGPDWTVPVSASGVTTVELALYPTSQNRYGPHHHYLGDPRVVSPAQAHGVRNYADPDDAPQRTDVGEWMLRRLAAPTAATIVRDPDAGSLTSSDRDRILTDNL